jgi:hypothetical protein
VEKTLQVTCGVDLEASLVTMFADSTC